MKIAVNCCRSDLDPGLGVLFVKLVLSSGEVGATAKILGAGFNGSAKVRFNPRLEPGRTRPLSSIIHCCLASRVLVSAAACSA